MGARCSCDPCEEELGPLDLLDQEPVVTGAPQAGLCLSGGGLAAACAAIGALRALRGSSLDLLSTVAGSAWASAAYVFGAASDVHLLGPSSSPSLLTLEELDALPPPLLQRATCQLPCPNARTLEELRRWLASCWLEPFALNGKRLAGSAQEQRRILQEYPELEEEEFLLQRADRPTWLVGGSLVAGKEQLPFQISASTVAGPPDFRTLEPIGLQPIVSPFFQDKEGALYSFGSIDTFAFGSPSEEPAKRPFTLADILTLSGLSRAGGTLGRQVAWPLQATTGVEARFADGGCTDNSGLMALLQRGVRHIVWFDFSFESLDGAATAAQSSLKDIMEKFGCAQPGSRASAKQSQVFRETELSAVLQQLTVRRDAGEPGVVRRRLRLLPNEKWQIRGGQTVELVLIHLESGNSDFLSRLPQETRDELLKGQSGSFPNFPFLRPSAAAGASPCFTQRQANLLAAFAEYAVRCAGPLINSLIPASVRFEDVSKRRSQRSLIDTKSVLGTDFHRV